MDKETILVTPDTPQRALLDKLNNVLTGIALNAGLLRSRLGDGPASSSLDDIESSAAEAVALVRQLQGIL